MSLDVVLRPLKELSEDGLDRALTGIAQLMLAEGQSEFVGQPLKMALAGLGDPDRHPFVVVNEGVVVGMGTLQCGAARLAGWPDNDSALLLRGFLIGAAHQGQGYGRLAAAACVELAARLAAAGADGSAGRALGVVLSVNTRNHYGLSAYAKAGFVDRGEFLGGRTGPQRIMYRAFTD